MLPAGFVSEHRPERVQSLPNAAFEWQRPYMDKGEPELQEPPIFLLTTMPIFSIRKKDNVIFIDTDITGKPCLGCGSRAVLRLSSSFKAAPADAFHLIYF